MDTLTLQKTQKTWDTIAKSFDTTRKKPWDIVLEFIDSLSSSAQIIDLGSGNGRHLNACAKHCRSAIGFDISKNLLKIALNKTTDKNLSNVFFLHGTLTQIPLKDNSCDAVIYIAALHNIPENKQRQQSLQEVQRILKPGGQGLISVWSRWQKKYRYYFLKTFFMRNGKEFGDIEISWRQHNLDIPRFYHLYSKHEFIKAIQKSGLTLHKIHRQKDQKTHNTDNYFAYVKKD